MSPSSRLPRLTLAAGFAALALPHLAAAMLVSGPVSGTWRATDSPILATATIVVPAGATLRLERGTVVLFADGAGLDVDGTLLVEGTPANVVRLQSASASPRPGDWQGVALRGAGSHLLRGVLIQHADVGLRIGDRVLAAVENGYVFDSLRDGVRFEPGSGGHLSDCVVAGNGASGLHVEDSSPRVERCRFTSSLRAVTLAGSAFPALSHLTASGHFEHDGVVVDPEPELSGQGTWTGGGLPLLVPEDVTLRVTAQATRTLAAGTDLQFGRRARVELSGTLSCPDGCRLAGRDGGVDGGEPDKGWWRGIEVHDGGSLYLFGADLRDADDGIRVLPGGRADIVGSRVHHNLNRGLAFGPGASGLLQGSSLHDNDIGVQVADASAIDLGRLVEGQRRGGHNSFTCNGILDVQNLAEETLPAHWNFWPSGAGGPAVAGDVDTGWGLLGEPDETAARRRLRAARTGARDVLLHWEDAGSCHGFDVFVAAAAAGPFVSFVRDTTSREVVAEDVVGAEPALYFKVLPRF